MPLDWSPLVDFLRLHDRPLLMTHIRPDADGLGAQLALHDALTAIGKKPRVAIASKLLPRYEFLDPKRAIVEDFKPAAFTDCDSVVVLDTGTWNQLGDFGKWLQASPLPRAVVDHHRTQDDIASPGLQMVDITAEATGRLAYEIIRALGAPLSAGAAHNLFMAIATDTGWFRHPNATAPTFALCGELVARGARPTELYEQLYEAATLARFKLTAVALQRLTVVGKIAYTEIALSDYPGTGAVPGDTEDLINYPRGVEGVEIALVFIEQHDGGTKVSFRSRAADVSKLAEKFGGGGHKLASGARVMGKLADVRDQVLAAAKVIIEEKN